MRMLIVGWDGATFDLIDPWIQAGYLPNIASLMAHGSSWPLTSVPNMNSAPAWASFSTGVNPGKHGVFFFNELIRGTYQWRYLNGSDIRVPAFWEYLGAAGVRAGIVNVPMTYPAKTVNGYMLAGLDSPSVTSQGFSYPDNLIKDMLLANGNYVIEAGAPGLARAGKWADILAGLMDEINSRLRHSLWLMQHYPVDMQIVVFTATDKAHHFFWKDMDRTHPYHDQSRAGQFGDAIFRVYQECDIALGKLLDAAQPDNVIVMSDHGGGFNQRGGDFLPLLLRQSGWLRRNRAKSSQVMMRSLYQVVNRLASRDVKQWLAHRLSGVRARTEATMILGDIDWRSTRAFCTGTTDDAYLNVIDREPLGFIPPEKYDGACQELLELLRSIEDAEDGSPAIEWASNRKDVYTGPFTTLAPDIIIKWNTRRVFRQMRIKGHEPISLPEALQSGGHRPDGILVASGKDFRISGRQPNASIMDIAPTALHLLDHAIPAHMDGHALSDSLQNLRDIQFMNDAHGQNGQMTSRDFTDAEQKLIEARLRELGYVE